jgi:hypothetical protein
MHTRLRSLFQCEHTKTNLQRELDFCSVRLEMVTAAILSTQKVTFRNLIKNVITDIYSRTSRKRIVHRIMSDLFRMILVV